MANSVNPTEVDGEADVLGMFAVGERQYITGTLATTVPQTDTPLVDALD
jgi:hypothetical protein